MSLLLAAAATQAQYPYGGGYGGYGYGGYSNGGYNSLLNGPYGSYGGNYGGYTPGSRGPVSPYLNLLNGGTANNTGSNYYNFVRPLTLGPQNRFATGFGGMGGANALRGSYFPVLDQLDEDFKSQIPEADKEKWKVTETETLIPVQMAPSGHQAGFGNTLGYFGSTGAGQGASRTQQPQQQQPATRYR